MAQHSPAPWTFEDEFIHDATGRTIADPYCMPTPETNEGEMEANAQLMAAAPDLLEALQSYNNPRYGDDRDFTEIARAAIAKATTP